MEKKLICLFLLLSGVLLLAAQPERKLAREGNKLYEEKKYADAEASYKKALNVKNNMPEAIFNLGDAMYQQKRWDDAAAQFKLSTTLAGDSVQKAAAYHNLGNTLYGKEDYSGAVDAYKRALRILPSDKDTRYNLALANAKLKQQQQQNQQDQKNQNKQQDQKQDQQDQNKQNQDKQDQNKQEEQKADSKKPQQKDGEKGQEQKSKQEQGQGKFSREQAERLLQSLGKEEEKTQQKMQLQQVQAVDVKILKDW